MDCPAAGTRTAKGNPPPMSWQQGPARLRDNDAAASASREAQSHSRRRPSPSEDENDDAQGEHELARFMKEGFAVHGGGGGLGAEAINHAIAVAVPMI